MTFPLLTTKLFIPPPQASLLRRPRLTAEIDAGLSGPLTLISAPPGFGKTTLLADWRTSSPSKEPSIAWYTLDEGDNQPSLFCRYLLAALRRLPGEADTLAELETLVDSAGGHFPLQHLFTQLINHTSNLPRRAVLVLDDFHTLTNPELLAAMEYWIEHNPPQSSGGLHLILATRSDPPLPLSRWRSRGWLREVRAAQLRFSDQETGLYFKSNVELEISSSHMQNLIQKTEGWPAGLQLAGISLRQRGPAEAEDFLAGFSGRSQFILDYLSDEVLDHLSADILAFLLKTSLLNRICAPLAAAIQDKPLDQVSPQLAYILRHNLFLTPLDDEGYWYRYHPLFADLLRMRLNQQSPDHVNLTHRRAAHWFAAHSSLSEAIHHALAAREYSQAAVWIEEVIVQPGVWSHGEIRQLLQWIDRLPEQVLLNRPRLMLYYSRALNISGKFTEGGALLDKLNAKLPVEPPAEDSQFWAEVRAHQARQASFQGNLRIARDYGQQALAILPTSAVLSRFSALSALALSAFLSGDLPSAARLYPQVIQNALAFQYRFAAVAAGCDLSKVLLYMGDLRAALNAAEEALNTATLSGTRLPAAGLALLVRGQVLYELERLPEAERDLRDGLELTAQGGISANFGLGQMVLAQVLMALGKAEEANQMIQEGLLAARQVNIPRNTRLAEAYAARLALTQSDIAYAQNWLAQDQTISIDDEMFHDFELLTQAAVLVATKQSDQAIQLIDSLLLDIQANHRQLWLVEGLAMRADARQQKGQETFARQDRSRALRLGRELGLRRTLIDSGLAPHHALPEKPARQGQLIEPLTDREQEVLALLCQGLSNREMCDQLVLSNNTLKTHLQNLYAKLGVHSRLQAVRLAQQLNLRK